MTTTYFSNQMNILVYGSRGWIGGQFIEILKQKGISYQCGNARVDNEDAVEAELDLVHLLTSLV